MHPIRPVILVLLTFYAVAAPAAESRFSGSAAIAEPAESNASMDGRFSIHADLSPAAITQRTSRFDIKAKLQPDAKSIATVCGPLGESIFKNGFE